MTGTQETHDALTTATAEAREVIKELHGLLKDLRYEIKAGTVFRDHLVDHTCKTVLDMGDKAVAAVQGVLDEKLFHATETTPISLMCSACGEVLALATAYGETNICAACGHKFIIRARVQL